MLNERDRQSLRMAFAMGVGDKWDALQPDGDKGTIPVALADVVEVESLAYFSENDETFAGLMAQDEALAHKAAYDVGAEAHDGLCDLAGIEY